MSFALTHGMCIVPIINVWGVLGAIKATREIHSRELIGTDRCR